MQGYTTSSGFRALIDRPIFLVSMPRSGSTLLFETLSRSPDLFTTGSESHGRIEQIADFHPRKRGFTSNRLDASDAHPDAVAELAASFYEALRDRSGTPAEGPVRMLEKTPKNALRVPFFDAIWPDAIFLFLYRDPRQSLASMIEAWESGRFVTYPRLPNWIGNPWSLLLVPGWRDLIGRALANVVASQWAEAMSILVDDLDGLPQEKVRAIDYSAFVADPAGEMQRLTQSLGIAFDEPLGQKLPLSRYTVSAPDPDKWRRQEDRIAPVLSIVEAAERKAKALIEKVRAA